MNYEAIIVYLNSKHYDKGISPIDPGKKLDNLASRREAPRCNVLIQRRDESQGSWWGSMPHQLPNLDLLASQYTALELLRLRLRN